MISHALGNVFEAANSIQKWTPARGHAYATPTIPRASTLEPKEPTPLPDSQASSGRPGQSWAPPTANKASTIKTTELDSRLAEESFAIHTAFGGDYMDEIPITGKPGDFHFASTGRKDKLAVPVPHAPAVVVKAPALAPLNTTKAAEVASPKDVKKTKSPKPGSAKAKDRRKSKGGTATATGTPTPS